MEEMKLELIREHCKRQIISAEEHDLDPCENCKYSKECERFNQEAKIISDLLNGSCLTMRSEQFEHLLTRIELFMKEYKG